MNQFSNSLALNKAYEKILEVRDALKDKISKEIIFSSPIITREEQGIIYPNTINVIQGKAGAHKSRLVELICALMLGGENANSTLGYSIPWYRSEDFFVSYFDTERNTKEQFPFALKRILRQAGLPDTEKPYNLDFVSLISAQRSERLDILKLHINLLRQNVEKHLIIVLDVLTDCLGNFNDPKESLQLIDFMNQLINHYDVTFITVIHENPTSGEKARGHVGTELLNKASTQIQIGFEKESKSLIRIKYLKNRHGRRPEDFYVEYNELTRCLQLVDDTVIENYRLSNIKKAPVEDIEQVLPELVKGKISRETLIASLRTKFECSRNTVIERIKHFTDKRKVEGENGVEYLFNSEKQGREVFYSLIQQKSINTSKD